MSCCNTEEIEEMIRVIMLRLGTAQYPATVPANLADEEDETLQIENLTDLVGWGVRQMDAVVGQFPIDIEIKDADPSQSGNQTRKVKLPNLAEAIAEVYALSLRSGVGSDIHTSFLMRLAAEVIAIKNAALITQDYAKANASYLGYKGNTVRRKVNYAFNVTNLENLEKILQESEKAIIGWQDEDKNTVQAYLEKLMFVASIIKLTHFRSNKAVDGLVGELGNLLGIEEESEESEDESEDNWRAFLQEINNAQGGFNRNSPVKPEVIDPSVSGETSIDTRLTGFDTIPGPSETTTSTEGDT